MTQRPDTKSFNDFGPISFKEIGPRRCRPAARNPNFRENSEALT